MYTAEMPRKDKGFRLDIRIVEALAKVKDLTGKSSNAYVEELLMMNLKSLGIIPVDAEPLPEARGGKREGAGKPKRSPNDPADAEDSLDKDSGGSSEARSVADVDAIDSLPETTAGTGRKVKADVDAIDGGEYE